MKFIIAQSIAFFFCHFCAAQSIQQKISGQDTVITKVEIMDTNTNPITARSVFANGNSNDLAAYINSRFTFPEKCVQMGYVGNLYFSVAINDSLKFVEVKDARGLCDKADEIKQISDILQGVDKLIVLNNNRYFFIKINVDVHYAPLIKAEKIDIQVIHRKKRIRRQK